MIMFFKTCLGFRPTLHIKRNLGVVDTNFDFTSVLYLSHKAVLILRKEVEQDTMVWPLCNCISNFYVTNYFLKQKFAWKRFFFVRQL